MPLKHSDYITHIKNKEDQDILTRQGFDVNLRLFETSGAYRAIIMDMVHYIAGLVVKEKEGYSTPKGMSGANAGLPLNIIALNIPKENKAWDWLRFNEMSPVVLINPKITKYYGEYIETSSNCGSLTLPENIQVLRRELIDLQFYCVSNNGPTKLEYHELFKVGRRDFGFTIQHEVDHNLGTLIINRKVI